MDQERFDELAKKVFDASSRRRVLGGALASVFGAGSPRWPMSRRRARAKARGKHKKGKAKGAVRLHRSECQCGVPAWLVL